MSDKNALILEMISRGIETKDICRDLNITLKELKRRIESIKYSGYSINNQYYANGTKKYIIDHNPENLNINNKISIKKIDENKELKFIIISDTHIGHKKANLEYLKKVYEYARNKEINLFIHAGDLFEGKAQPVINLEEQMELFLREYPNEEDILTFISFGNHDEDFLTKAGLNINTIISRERDDLVPLGYNNSFINIFDNQINISHEGKFQSGHALKIAGHSHRYKFSTDFYNPMIVCPTLSDYLHTNDYPGAVEIHIAFEKGKFSHLIIKHLIISENGYVREVSTVDVPFQKKTKSK